MKAWLGLNPTEWDPTTEGSSSQQCQGQGSLDPTRKAFSSPHVSGWLSIPYFYPSIHLSGSICLHCAPLPSFHFWRVKRSQQGRGTWWEWPRLGQSFTHWSVTPGTGRSDSQLNIWTAPRRAFRCYTLELNKIPDSGEALKSGKCGITNRIHDLAAHVSLEKRVQYLFLEVQPWNVSLQSNSSHKCPEISLQPPGV